MNGIWYIALEDEQKISVRETFIHILSAAVESAE
jgi:hypothetical protein